MIPAPMPLTESDWHSPYAATLANQLQAIPDILQQSATEIAPHLVVRHLEAISETCHRWLDDFSPTPQAYNLLLVTKQTIFDLMENILAIALDQKIAAST
jgi:arginyl-tRNA synthetase